MAKAPKKYEVGFGKPPVDKQFGKGQSGNPRGRPKGSRNLASILEREMNAKIVIQENGRRKTITKLEAGVKQMINKAVTGDQKAMQQLLGLQHLVENAGKGGAPVTSESDQQIFSSILKRINLSKTGENHE